MYEAAVHMFKTYSPTSMIELDSGNKDDIQRWCIEILRCGRLFQLE
jgi:hypothetical protein